MNMLIESHGEAPILQHDSEPKPTSKVRKFAWLGAIPVVLLIGAYIRLQSSPGAADTNAPTSELRQVNVVRPVQSADNAVTLPATVQAYQATDLFARANGYLKSWSFEIGARVKRGQVLAEIETPELDQELAQSVALLKQGEAEHQQAVAELDEGKADVALAEANVVKAKAHVDFSVSQTDRYKKLLERQSVSQEEYENAVRERDARRAEVDSAKAELARRKTNLGTRQAIIESREAIVGNRKANVQRLRDLTGFQRVVAPFDGIVTRRNAEVGMLVTAGSNIGTRPLFSVAQTDVLRVQAAVPQSSALRIKSGDQADVMIPERPGQVLAAKVARTAGAVEPASRSLLVEVELPNADGSLPPGVYAQVRFRSQNQQGSWIVPSNVLQMRTSGAQVVVVAPDNTLRTQKVSLGRDFGSTVEVLVGLSGNERLVANPQDDLRDGESVQVAESKTDSRVAQK